MSSSRTTYDGGSSSVLSSALAASSFIVSARSSTNTRCVASNGVRDGGGDDRLVDVAPQHLVRAARRDPRQVGMRAVLRRGCARDSGSARLAREQRGGEARAASRLPLPGRAVQQVGVRRARRRARRRGRRRRGGGLELEHAGDASPACRIARRAARLLITVEGLDGAGKTTLVAGLAKALEQRGERVVVLREPGGVEVSERIRELVKDPALEIDARAEALLYAAARAQLVAEALRPLLDARREGAARPLRRLLARLPGRRARARRRGDPRDQRVRDRRAGARPHAAAAHRPGRRASARIADRPADRLEQEDVAFFAAIAAAYDELAAAEPERIAVIDASQSPEAVLSDALAAL